MIRWPWRRRGRKQTAAHAAGVWGEQVAEKALKKLGYRILGRRVRVGTRDELDLIARDGTALVFVEVKTRASEAFGRPLSSVNRAKRQALSRAAVRYIRKLRKPPDYFRFDVVEVVGGIDEKDPVIRHVQNAFTLHSRLRPWW